MTYFLYAWNGDCPEGGIRDYIGSYDTVGAAQAAIFRTSPDWAEIIDPNWTNENNGRQEPLLIQRYRTGKGAGPE